jgi:hypothetical protein
VSTPQLAAAVAVEAEPAVVTVAPVAVERSTKLEE